MARGARIFLCQQSRDITPGSPVTGRLCVQCGKLHWRLWLVRRVIFDTIGHFPVVRLNGEEIPIDGSLPTELDYMPRDAAEITDPDFFARLWHDNSGSHCFGAGIEAKPLAAAYRVVNDPDGFRDWETGLPLPNSWVGEYVFYPLGQCGVKDSLMRTWLEDGQRCFGVIRCL